MRCKGDKMIKTNELVLTKEDFGDQLPEVLGKTLITLTQAGYVAEVYEDEPTFNIIVIHYAYKDPEYGDAALTWMDRDELDDFLALKREANE